MSEYPSNVRVVGIRFQPTGKIYHFEADEKEDLQSGDFALVRTSRGLQLGEVAFVRFLREDEERGNLKPIQRRATSRDLAIRQHLQDKAEEAMDLAREIVDERNIPIKIADAEYTFDGRRLTIYYVSDKKDVNVREIHRRLRNEIPARVKLRRIGPRDHAKLFEGYGACGHRRCCARFITQFRPVPIKMAKTQGVSLNPSEITGMCGRLRCCLTYENDLYREAKKDLPRMKKLVKTPYGEGKVVDLMPLRGIVVVQIQDRRIEVAADEVQVINRHR